MIIRSHCNIASTDCERDHVPTHVMMQLQHDSRENYKLDGLLVAARKSQATFPALRSMYVTCSCNMPAFDFFQCLVGVANSKFHVTLSQITQVNTQQARQITPFLWTCM